MDSSPFDSPLPAGKLPADLLREVLAGLPGGDTRVVVGPQPGVDAAVIDTGDHYLVLAMDPVTLSGDPGRFAVAINANDVAAMGAEPRWLLASVILPAGATATDASRVVSQLGEACRELGVTSIGGHTEISASVTQTVVTACMIGEVAPERLVTSGGARPGDALLLAGPIAVEGTAILAREAAGVLRDRGLPVETIERAASLLKRPGISVLPAVRALTAAVRPHAMHDPTEGGLLTALREMAIASGAGLVVEADHVPILPECRAVCDALGLDPLGLLASGSLLAAIAAEDADAALTALADIDIESSVIGEVTERERGLTLIRAGRRETLPEIERDELARWLESRPQE